MLIVPLFDTGMLIGLAVAQALWLIARRVRTFAHNETDLALGRYGLVILPLRVVCKVASWVFALWVFALFITVAQEHFNGALTALLVGFVVAHSINLFISRYEQNFVQKRGVKN